MNDYILSCGSTADLTKNQMEQRDIRIEKSMWLIHLVLPADMD